MGEGVAPTTDPRQLLLRRTRPRPVASAVLVVPCAIQLPSRSGSGSQPMESGGAQTRNTGQQLGLQCREIAFFLMNGTAVRLLLETSFLT